MFSRSRTSGQFFQQLQYLLEELCWLIVALGEKGVGKHALWYGQTSELARDGNHRDHRESAANDREKLEAVHVRHAQVGDDDVRKRTFQCSETFKAILGSKNFVPLGPK